MNKLESGYLEKIIGYPRLLESLKAGNSLHIFMSKGMMVRIAMVYDKDGNRLYYGEGRAIDNALYNADIDVLLGGVLYDDPTAGGKIYARCIHGRSDFVSEVDQWLVDGSGVIVSGSEEGVCIDFYKDVKLQEKGLPFKGRKVDVLSEEESLEQNPA